MEMFAFVGLVFVFIVFGAVINNRFSTMQKRIINLEQKIYKLEQNRSQETTLQSKQRTTRQLPRE